MEIDERGSARIDAYLKDVSANLALMPARERQDLVDQLRSHIHEALQARTAGSDARDGDVEAVLSEMDPPESYATPEVCATGESCGAAATQQSSRASGKPLTALARLSLGKWALIIAIGGALAAGLLIAVGRGAVPVGFPFLLFLAAQIAAFVLGILSWREPWGKAATFTSAGLAIVLGLGCA